MGITMFFRTQSMFIIPAILLLAWFVYRRRHLAWLQATGLLLLGLALVTSPWLLRNYANKGQLVFDDPITQSGSMAQRYSLSGKEINLRYQLGEDERAYSARIRQSIIDFISTYPDVVARFVAGHFLNAEITGAFILPIRDGLAEPGEILIPTHPFWEFRVGSLKPVQVILLVFNLALIGLGIGVCWARLKWIGLVPLAANLSYHFSMALARNSGERYLLAVDWVVLVYASVGLIEIAIAVMAVLGIPWRQVNPLLSRRTFGETESIPAMRIPLRNTVFIGLILVLIGSLLPFVEWVVPQHYPDQTRPSLVAEVLEDPLLDQSDLDLATIERFISDPNVMVIKGRGFYPRFYNAGEGEEETAKIAYEPLDFARTVFLVASSTYNERVVLRSRNVPTYFPNPSDVIVIGCPGKYLDAAVLIVKGDPGGVYTPDVDLSNGCPLPAPGN